MTGALELRPGGAGQPGRLGRGKSLDPTRLWGQVGNETTSQPAGFVASFKRNLPLIIPLVILLVASQLREGHRIGDGWARTRVVWKRYRDKAPFAA